jgi:hypothetical protein
MSPHEQIDSPSRKPPKERGGTTRKTASGKQKQGTRTSHFQQRLGEKISQLMNLAGGYLPLENAIREAFELAEKDKSVPGRRQLQKIVEGKDIPLRFEQMDLLDRFLRLRGHESLADLLNPPSVLRFIAEEGRITFIMGSQPHQDEVRRMDYFSRWDINAMQTIQKGLYATGKPLQIMIEDVILRGHEVAGFRDEGVSGPDQEWLNLVENLDGSGESLIVLGSPRVNHGAEKVLAAMLGVEPFRPWPSNRISERPFAFCWPEWWRHGKHSESCMHFDPADDPRVPLGDADLQFLQQVKSRGWNALKQEEVRFHSAVIANGRFYPIRRGEEWSYAVIVARRGLHRTCACICGATGPATLAAARVFESFVPQFSKEGRDDRVAWCLVKADVRDDPRKPSFRADRRIVVNQGIVDNKTYFYPPDRS